MQLIKKNNHIKDKVKYCFYKILKNYHLLLLLIIFIYVNHNYFFYLTSRLHEYGDTLHHVRQLDYLSQKLAQFKFKEVLTLPHFYPRKYTLFYSDTLLPQAILLVPFRILIDNPFTIFNIAVLTNSLLNLIFGYYLVSQLTKNKNILLIGTLSLIFNPFVIYHLGHFQLQVLWPIFLILSELIKLILENKESANKNRKLFKKSLIISVAFSILLYSSPYLLIIFLPLYLLINISFIKKKPNIFLLNLQIFSLCLFTVIPFLYFDNLARSQTNQQPESQFIMHSANLIDYLIPLPEYLLTDNKFGRYLWKINNQIGERGYYQPLFITSICFFIYLKFIKKISFKKKNEFILVKTFCISSLIAFLLSLGPFFQIKNGVVLFELPGIFLMKLPVFSSMRAVSRWEFLFSLSISLTFIILLKILLRYKKNKFNYLNIFMFFYFFYLIPTPFLLKPLEVDWSSDAYRALPANCNETLLELPAQTYLQNKNHQYSKLIFWSTKYHNCNLINGSASFLPLDYINFFNELNTAEHLNFNSLYKYNIDYIKINLNYTNLDESDYGKKYKYLYDFCELIFKDNNNLIFDCKHINDFSQ